MDNVQCMKQPQKQPTGPSVWPAASPKRKDQSSNALNDLVPLELLID
jgi:hypothetical protein